MPTESTDIQLARIDERMKAFLGAFDEIRKTSHSQGELLQSVLNRTENIEKAMNKNAPTIDEFITIKHQVVGAGKMGKWIYAGAGALIGILATIRTDILEWLAK